MLLTSHVDSMQTDAEGNLIVENTARMIMPSALCLRRIWTISVWS